MADATSATSARGRILVVHPGADLYGSDRVLLDSVGALVEFGWSVTVALPEDGPLFKSLDASGVDVVRCNTPVLRKQALRPTGFMRLIAETLLCIRPALRLVRNIDPAVIYVSTVTIPMWVVLARLLRVRVVCHVHEAESSAPLIAQRAMALPLVAANAIIVNSEFTLGVLLHALPMLAPRSTIVRNPVPGPERVEPTREQIDAPLRLLYVGRLSPRKGPDVAVRALAELKDRGISATLSLMGDVFPGYEWFETELRRLVNQDGLQENIEFLGFREGIWRDMDEADIVVVPSVMVESFGNAAVEAILAARPVVVSRTGGLVEAVGDFEAVRFVQPGDPSELADSIVSILQSWQSVRQQAIEDSVLARERHDPRHYGERLDKVISAVQ